MNFLRTFKNYLTKDIKKYTNFGKKAPFKDKLGIINVDGTEYQLSFHGWTELCNNKEHTLNIDYFFDDLNKFIQFRRYQMISLNKKYFSGSNYPYQVSIDSDPSTDQYKIKHTNIEFKYEQYDQKRAWFELALDESGDRIPSDIAEKMIQDVKSYFKKAREKYPYTNSKFYKVVSGGYNDNSKDNYIAFFININIY